MLIPAVLLLLQTAPPASACTQVSTTSAAASELCQGEQASRNRRWPEAAQHYRRAVDLASDAEGKQRALDALADVYDTARLNRPDLLEGVLREEIALNPQRLSPQFRLAKLQEEQGLIDIAEETLLLARRQNPSSEEPYRMLAQFYARRVTALRQASQAQAPPKANDQPGEKDDDGVYRVGGGIESPRRLDVAQYPPEAQAVGVQGIVQVEVVINEEGHVAQAKVTRSIPFLDEAALAAVREWRFKPTMVNGQPVPVRTTLMVNFTLPK
ncbi:MAG TPA: energy transducer TonB [Vicinamibacterales bacterium]|jgi:TonB family protein